MELLGNSWKSTEKIVLKYLLGPINILITLEEILMDK